MKPYGWCLVIGFGMTACIGAQEMDMRMVLDMLPPNTFVPPSPNPEARKAMDIQSYFLEKMFLDPLMSSEEKWQGSDPDDEAFEVESTQTKGLMNGLMGKMMAGQLAKRDILRLKKTLRVPSTEATVTAVGTKMASPLVQDRQPYRIELGW